MKIKFPIHKVLTVLGSMFVILIGCGGPQPITITNLHMSNSQNEPCGATPVPTTSPPVTIIDPNRDIFIMWEDSGTAQSHELTFTIFKDSTTSTNGTLIYKVLVYSTSSIQIVCKNLPITGSTTPSPTVVIPLTITLTRGAYRTSVSVGGSVYNTYWQIH